MGRLFPTLALIATLAGCAVSPTPDIAQAEAPELEEQIPAPAPAPRVALAPPEDLWERVRRQLRFHSTDNEQITRARKNYLRQPRYAEVIAPRAERYLYHLVTEVERRDLPMELALLPLVESTLNPFAYSPQEAAGLWQIMPGTADQLGMRRDWWFDARLDVRESTHFALDHLQYLHREFDGDWLLALAAYNAGEYRVKRLRAHQRRAGLNDDFWSLPLPRETRRYVPRLLALSSLVASDEAFGMHWPAVPNRPAFVAVDTGGQIEMLRAAELSGLSLDTLRAYNPGLLRWATLPGSGNELLVPLASATALRSGLAALPEEQRVTWQYYRIRRGDSLIRIARRFDTDVGLLREVNNLRGSFIRAGDRLMIPDNAAWRESLAMAGGSSNGVKQGYRVRSGDSLYRIASRFKVTIDELINWNQLDPEAYLQPGQSLTLYVDGG